MKMYGKIIPIDMTKLYGNTLLFYLNEKAEAFVHFVLLMILSAFTGLFL